VKRRRHPWTYNDSHVHRRPREWMVRTDIELVRLARGAAGLRLAIGEGLAVLRRRALDLELGFSSNGAYAFERLGQRPRWADDTRRVAERLASLPILRDAVRSGELGWSMAELLARHATPENEAALLDEARALTFRALRERLEHAREGNGADADPGDAGDAQVKRTERLDMDEEDEPPRRSLSLTVDREVAWALEGTRAVVAAISGTPSTDHFVEALLAEGIVTLQNLCPHLRVPDELDDDERAKADQWRAQLDAWRKELERDCEARVPEYTDADVDPDDLGDLWRDLESLDLQHMAAEDLDAHLRGLAQQLAQRDLKLGELALDFMAQGGSCRLGYGSHYQYLRERLRISHASFKAHMTLARQSITLPEVAASLEAGVIGFEAARLVCRVAERRTVQAWLERATRRTVKHLREEVECVESVARATGERQRGPEPPDEETMAAYLELQCAMLDGRVARAIANANDNEGACEDVVRGQMSVEAAEGQMSVDGDGGQMSVDAGEGQMSVSPKPAPDEELRPGAGLVTMRLSLPEELIRYWHLVKAMFRRSALPGTFESFLVAAFWNTWLVEDPDDKVAYQHIYQRDRYRCTSPVCSRTDVTPHHLTFRSRGGGEEDENLSSVCVICHLDLVHGGRITAEPPASRVRWTIGRLDRRDGALGGGDHEGRGLITVIGREKVA